MGLYFSPVLIFTYNPDMTMQTVFQAPRSNKRSRIPMRTIRALAKIIAEKFDPEEIILFGSHAYGKPRAWSDVDLLVIMNTPKGEMDAILKVSDSLPDLPFSVDIVVRSRKVLEKRKKLGDWFLREITKKGKVLYERAN
jgi:predicted nucleotidyltransferase